MRLIIMALCCALALGCSGKSDGTGDPDADTTVDSIPDTVLDTAEDTLEDAPTDTTPEDTAEDTAEDTLTDTADDTAVEDTTPDPTEDTETDTADDIVADTSIDTGVEPDVTDVIDEFICSDPCKVGGVTHSGCMAGCGGFVGTPCPSSDLTCVYPASATAGFCIPTVNLDCSTDANCECFPAIAICSPGRSVWTCPSGTCALDCDFT
jgi:hypothetical protein